MQKNVELSADELITELGNDKVYINLYRRIESATDENGNNRTRVVAGEQYAMTKPVCRGRVINAIVSENYPDGAQAAALRKGIANPTDEDYVAFNNYVEALKTLMTNEGL